MNTESMYTALGITPAVHRFGEEILTGLRARFDEIDRVAEYNQCKVSLEIMTLLERINALGTTVVVVTHERDLVNHFDKRVIMIDHGQVNGDGVGTYEV